MKRLLVSSLAVTVADAQSPAPRLAGPAGRESPACAD